ncbi:hypothetical protein M422DRAFT_266405 [Sphaerobolus stellatus SS14]|uniref:Uncharacterized protein n=1 Tax=Sphaerobolus stellatus (strain SS14) TaxID=990650 RepID=A0A0C9URW0_SPHS4|nr:hypothetical protein M422DRAFT_266405 [Sphaerobolus stellatus SS14]
MEAHANGHTLANRPFITPSPHYDPTGHGGDSLQYLQSNGYPLPEEAMSGASSNLGLSFNGQPVLPPTINQHHGGGPNFPSFPTHIEGWNSWMNGNQPPSDASSGFPPHPVSPADPSCLRPSSNPFNAIQAVGDEAGSADGQSVSSEGHGAGSVSSGFHDDGVMDLQQFVSDANLTTMFPNLSEGGRQASPAGQEFKDGSEAGRDPYGGDGLPSSHPKCPDLSYLTNPISNEAANYVPASWEDFKWLNPSIARAPNVRNVFSRRYKTVVNDLYDCELECIATKQGIDPKALELSPAASGVLRQTLLKQLFAQEVTRHGGEEEFHRKAGDAALAQLRIAGHDIHAFMAVLVANATSITSDSVLALTTDPAVDLALVAMGMPDPSALAGALQPLYEGQDKCFSNWGYCQQDLAPTMKATVELPDAQADALEVLATGKVPKHKPSKKSTNTADNEDLSSDEEFTNRRWSLPQPLSDEDMSDVENPAAAKPVTKKKKKVVVVSPAKGSSVATIVEANELYRQRTKPSKYPMGAVTPNALLANTLLAGWVPPPDFEAFARDELNGLDLYSESEDGRYDRVFFKSYLLDMHLSVHGKQPPTLLLKSKQYPEADQKVSPAAFFYDLARRGFYLVNIPYCIGFGEAFDDIIPSWDALTKKNSQLTVFGAMTWPDVAYRFGLMCIQEDNCSPIPAFMTRPPSAAEGALRQALPAVRFDDILATARCQIPVKACPCLRHLGLFSNPFLEKWGKSNASSHQYGHGAVARAAEDDKKAKDGSDSRKGKGKEDGSGDSGKGESKSNSKRDGGMDKGRSKGKGKTSTAVDHTASTAGDRTGMEVQLEPRRVTRAQSLQVRAPTPSAPAEDSHQQRAITPAASVHMEASGPYPGVLPAAKVARTPTTVDAAAAAHVLQLGTSLQPSGRLPGLPETSEGSMPHPHPATHIAPPVSEDMDAITTAASARPRSVEAVPPHGATDTSAMPMNVEVLEWMNFALHVAGVVNDGGLISKQALVVALRECLPAEYEDQAFLFEGEIEKWLPVYLEVLSYAVEAGVICVDIAPNLNTLRKLNTTVKSGAFWGSVSGQMKTLLAGIAKEGRRLRAKAAKSG